MKNHGDSLDWSESSNLSQRFSIAPKERSRVLTWSFASPIPTNYAEVSTSRPDARQVGTIGGVWGN